MEQKTINQNKLQTLLCIIALTLGVLVSAVLFSMPPVHAAESEKEYDYTFFYTTQSYKYELNYSGDRDAFFTYYAANNFYIDARQTTALYSRNADGTQIVKVNPVIVKRYKYDSDSGDYVLDTSYEERSSEYTGIFALNSYNGGYLDLNSSGLKILFLSCDKPNDVLLEYSYDGTTESLQDGESFFALTSTKLLPYHDMYYNYGWSFSANAKNLTVTTTLSDDGLLTWKSSSTPKNCEFSGVSFIIRMKSTYSSAFAYRTAFPSSGAVNLNLKTLYELYPDLYGIQIVPYYVAENHRLYCGAPQYVTFDSSASYATRDGSVPFYFNNDWSDPTTVVKPGTDNDFSGGVTDPSNYLYPDESNTTIQGNNSIKLIDFNVDKNFKASWSGLDGIGSQTSKYSFIEFEVAFASNNSPGNVLTKKVVKERCSISKGSFQIPSEYTTFDSNSYVLYVKATPYHYNGDNPTHRLYKGSMSYKYFNSDGTPSWDYSESTDLPSGGGGIRRGTVNLTDFLLSGVSVKDSLLGYSTITWTGTTKDNDLLFIPESDTLVIASYILTTKNGDDYKYTPVTYTTTTINAGKINVNVAKLVEEAQKSGEAWDMQIRLTPAYTSNGILYMGEQTVCHMTDKSVKNETTTPDGSIKIDDVTNNVVPGDVDGKVEITADDLAGYTNTFVSFLKGLISAMGQIPQLLGTVFSFLPDMYRNAIGILFVVILILRILGR